MFLLGIEMLLRKGRVLPSTLCIFYPRVYSGNTPAFEVLKWTSECHLQSHSSDADDIYSTVRTK